MIVKPLYFHVLELSVCAYIYIHVYNIMHVYNIGVDLCVLRIWGYIGVLRILVSLDLSLS